MFIILCLKFIVDDIIHSNYLRCLRLLYLQKAVVTKGLSVVLLFYDSLGKAETDEFTAAPAC